MLVVVEHDEGAHVVHGPFDTEDAACSYADALYVYREVSECCDWGVEVCSVDAPLGPVIAIAARTRQDCAASSSLDEVYRAAMALPEQERERVLALLRKQS